MVVTECQENESCSKVKKILERLDNIIRRTHQDIVAEAKP